MLERRDEGSGGGCGGVFDEFAGVIDEKEGEEAVVEEVDDGDDMD